MWISFIVTQNSSSKTSSLVFGVVLALSLPILLSQRGKSAHRKHVHLQYPLRVQSTIFLFQMKPQLPHCIFPASLKLSFCFFSERGVTGLWFSHYTLCTGSVLWQNRSLSLFPLLIEGHRAKFNTNNKITVTQNIHFHIYGVFI